MNSCFADSYLIFSHVVKQHPRITETGSSLGGALGYIHHVYSELNEKRTKKLVVGLGVITKVELREEKCMKFNTVVHRVPLELVARL
jgi:hypothetical protein